MVKIGVKSSQILELINLQIVHLQNCSFAKFEKIGLSLSFKRELYNIF